MTTTLATPPQETQTCSNCPLWQRSTKTPNVGHCPHYTERTFGHDKAGENCPDPQIDEEILIAAIHTRTGNWISGISSSETTEAGLVVVVDSDRFIFSLDDIEAAKADLEQINSDIDRF